MEWLHVLQICFSWNLSEIICHYEFVRNFFVTFSGEVCFNSKYFMNWLTPDISFHFLLENHISKKSWLTRILYDLTTIDMVIRVYLWCNISAKKKHRLNPSLAVHERQIKPEKIFYQLSEHLLDSLVQKLSCLLVYVTDVQLCLSF